MKFALAGLFFLTLGGFVAATVGVAVRGVGEVVQTVALPAYLVASVALPLAVLTDAVRGIANWGRNSRSDLSGREVFASLLAAVEVALAVPMLLVVGGLAYLRLTQSPGPGAGGVLVGGMLVTTLVGSCLAAAVLLGNALGVRSRS